MSTEIDETFSAALRALLVRQAAGARSPRGWLQRRRRWSIRAGLVAALLVSGGGIAAGTGLLLAGGPPGSQRVTALAAPVTVTGDGTETVALGPRPAGANAVYTYLSCLSPGRFEWADGAILTCGSQSGALSQSDVRSSLAHPAMYTVALTPGQDTTTITAAPGERWRLTAIYASAVTTAWKVNASGQTYGTINQSGSPDLVAAIATNGRHGYVYANQLMGPQPTTPSQATTWAQTHPGPRTITVYDSDGKTAIGRFVLSQGRSVVTGTSHSATIGDKPTSGAQTAP